MQIVAGANVAIAPGQPIELAFDRLLLPLCIVRQTFVLEDLNGNALAPPAVAYDPVARVVTITPQPGGVAPGQSYRLFIRTPASAEDPTGLRAIDGATLDPQWTEPLTFPVLGDAGAAPVPPTIDFCSQILKGPFTSCGSGLGCHATPSTAGAGLVLEADQGMTQNISATALGRAAQGSNTGPSRGAGNAPQAPPVFGVDMPIVDNNGGTSADGDPGNSWLIYKLLLAVPPTTPLSVNAYSVAWQPLSDAERARLANFIPGREMPFPPNPSAPLDANPLALTLDQLEDVSLWIAQGANIPASCP